MISAITIGKNYSSYRLLQSIHFILRMAELALVDYFIMGEAVGIVATFIAVLYYSRKQMQKLSVDIETKVLSDLDEKILGLTQMAVEKPELIRIVSNLESDLTKEVAYTYHLRQRKVVSDNEWAGWLRMMRSCFEQGKVREYWESDLELENWFDPKFQDFIDNEIVRKTKPKQERESKAE